MTLSRSPLRFSSLAPLLIFLLVPLLFGGCMDRIDYDVEEVADQGHLRGSDRIIEQEPPDTLSANPSGRYNATFLCVSDNSQTEAEGEESIPTESTLHEHDAGQRNHGTEWLFNQPWAASFIWPKMARDTVILIVLAAAVLTLSNILGRRRR